MPALCDARPCPYRQHALATAEVIRRSAGQVRVAMGGVYALDFGAALMLAQAMGALSPLLVDVLPQIEAIIVAAYRRHTGDGG